MDPGTEEAGSAPRVQPRSSHSPSPSPAPLDPKAQNDPTQSEQSQSQSHIQTLADLQAEVETEAAAEAEGQPEAEEQQQSPASSSKSRPVSGVIPPWWQRHERNVSRASQSSLHNTITLEDHTADPNSETSRGLWARSVAIDDHCVVQGKTGVGAYVVWNCVVQTLDVSGVYGSYNPQHCVSFLLFLFCYSQLLLFSRSLFLTTMTETGRSNSRSHEILRIR